MKYDCISERLGYVLPNFPYSLYNVLGVTASEPISESYGDAVLLQTAELKNTGRIQFILAKTEF